MDTFNPPKPWWRSNGHRRHVFIGDAEQALCEAVASSRFEAYDHPPCLACLHARGLGALWGEYNIFGAWCSAIPVHPAWSGPGYGPIHELPPGAMPSRIVSFGL